MISPLCFHTWFTYQVEWSTAISCNETYDLCTTFWQYQMLFPCPVACILSNNTADSSSVSDYHTLLQLFNFPSAEKFINLLKSKLLWTICRFSFGKIWRVEAKKTADGNPENLRNIHYDKCTVQIKISGISWKVLQHLLGNVQLHVKNAMQYNFDTLQKLFNAFEAYKVQA